VTALRQITYIRVVDKFLQPNYAFLPAPLPARADLSYDRVDPFACGTPYSQCLSIPAGYCPGWVCHKCKLEPTLPNHPVCYAVTVTAASATASAAGTFFFAERERESEVSDCVPIFWAVLVVLSRN
jgi:hypothetical protein